MMVRYSVGVLLAVLLSNAVTLTVYFAGYSTLALLLSAPVGLLVGGLVGWHIGVSERRA